MAGICVSALSWKASRPGKLRILKDINLNAGDGEIFSLIGPSGSGKTSLLRCIAGLITDYTGSVSAGGSLIDGLPPERRGTVLMRQSGSLFPHLSAAENIAFGLKVRHKSRREIKTTVEKFLSMIRLTDRANAYPPELSAGQAQRVALAMALAISPGAILLDEPFSNLDPVMVKDIRGETRELISQAGITTIIATHDWEDAFLLGQKVGLILEGRLMVLRDDGLPENGDEEAMGYLKDLRVIRGRVENGIFIAAGISIPAKVPDGECRALVTGESITLLPL